MLPKSILSKWGSPSDLSSTFEGLCLFTRHINEIENTKKEISLSGCYHRLQFPYRHKLKNPAHYYKRMTCLSWAALKSAWQDLLQIKILAFAKIDRLDDNDESIRERKQAGKTSSGGHSPIAWIIGLVLLLLILGLIWWLPCPSNAQFFIFRISLALAAGGLASVLTGSLQISWSPGISAGGGLAVFILVYYASPNIVNDDRCQTTTSLTVFVHGKSGPHDIILRQQGHVVLDVHGERKRQAISENGEAYFPNLRVGDTVRLNVDFSEPYRALNSDSLYVIRPNGKIYLPVALQGLDRVSGTVIWRDQPVPDVIVSINTIRDTTDATGYYELYIPEALQRREQTVSFFKPGFNLLRKKAYPQTRESLNVVLSRQ